MFVFGDRNTDRVISLCAFKEDELLKSLLDLTTAIIQPVDNLIKTLQ